MPKLKTKKALAKRFKITKSGKIMRHKSCRGHLLTNKSRKKVRNLGNSCQVAKCDEGKIRKLLAR